ncbi:hypothetical protein IAD21_01769 [Abditibacteriota bacterium]|nr:hypothetical protein IAD21_01769 [Abditibacteriota bacterium]
MKNTFFLAGALLVLAPVVVLTVPGCSGGSGGPSPTATPTSTATATPSTNPTTGPTQGPAQTSNLTLGNGQRAVLTSRVTGTAIAGTIQILPAMATAAVKTRAIPFSFTAGTYNFTGTVTPPRGYSIQGNFGSFGAFTMTGQLPTATQAGSYTLTVNGQTESGVIPIPGQPFPTPVPTSVGGNYNLTGNLTFSNVSSGSDIVSTPLNSFKDLKQGGKLTNSTFNGTKFQSVALNGTTEVLNGNGTARILNVFLSSADLSNISNSTPFSVGQVLQLPASTVSSTVQLSQTTIQGTSIKIVAWRTTSGTATIKAIGTNSVTVELNAHFEPTGFGGGKGSFDLKGTLTGTGLEVKNQ